MKIEIAKHERMSESGSSLMRLIQNNELPTIDLLVRESIQNSSDAARDGVESVKVDYNVKEFTPEAVNRHFEDIEEKLNHAYQGQKPKLLEVRDGHTTGLEGPLTYEDAEDMNFGNLINLIYEISKPQQKEGAGGSWGLGKTVYFRIGIGLVIYYSRVKTESGAYESRIAACLIEDEKAKKTLLESPDKGPKRGIAWWGKKLDNSSEALNDKHSTTIPLTNDEEIEELLGDLNVEPYKGEETGTSIIIPYINEDKLIKNAKATTTGQNWWTSSLEDYLSICIQRWYAPRITNVNYRYNLPLVTSINGKRINAEDMLPAFKVIQDLYNSTSFSLKKKKGLLLTSEEQIYKEDISLRNVFTSSGNAGVIAFAKLTKDQLLMSYPHNNANPLLHANVSYQEETDMNPPLMSYIRKPGMIVNYDASGSWVKNIPSTKEDEFLIGLFIPNSQNQLKSEYNGVLLEEYLRKSEKADHTSWGDWTINDRNPLIVNKIKGHVGRKISDKYKDKNKDKHERKNASVGKAIAEILLPPENFGKQSGPKPGGGTKPGNQKDPRIKSTLKITGNPSFTAGSVSLPFTLTIGSKVKSSLLELKVVSEGGDIQADKWEKEDTIGSAFPLNFISANLDSVKVGKNNIVKNQEPIQLLGEQTVEHDEFSINRNVTTRFNVPFGMNVSNKSGAPVTLNGSITFKSTQSNIQGSLASKDNVGDDK
ncbi:hypothetical protein N780_08585 [Pontibacillus chungwhensis BH030062]|uniref:Uncharacterized protein n=1 Tax=Pontibacillus chungwhensis BH030062 TaxID=1385513 RepID=A0A0A2UXL7_9BACI|nr:hypothetical protein [Pontibacillus chungwhensis]KGP91256.1 hypothetical protein N780_08585 [Pontibacillus chungwhensis BH030062]